MRLGSILTFVAAAALAVVAGLGANAWLEAQRHTEAQNVVTPEAPTPKIVVASETLRFGTELSQANLKEVPWAGAALPDGAFGSVASLLSDKRVVLSTIDADEPIRKWKISGPGQRGALSSLIEGDQKAVTVRVDDVFGVAGFVMPGDRVDVMLTRADMGASEQKQFTDLLLQNVRVLAIDQSADDRADKANVVKAVTLEVNVIDAQKLALSRSVGNLSLALRGVSSKSLASTERVSADQLGSPPATPAPVDGNAGFGRVNVLRGLREPASYSVPLDNVGPPIRERRRKTAEAGESVDR